MTQVSPNCRVEGRFVVGGHAGFNRVPFTGRLRGRALPAGTYRITARTRGGGTVLRATLVIVESGPPSPTELENARHADVCGAQAALASSRVSGNAAAAAPEQSGRASGGGQSGDREPGGVAGASHTRAFPFSPAAVARNVANPFVIVALGLAVLLLGIAAVPERAIPDPQLTHVLVRHRAEVALAGAALLAAAIVALSFS